MCYAFTDKVEEQTERVFDVKPGFDQDQARKTLTTGHRGLMVTSLKRSADTTLEHETTKVAKRSKDGDSGNELGHSEATSEAQTRDEEVASLKKSLTQAKSRIEQLEKQHKALKEKNDSLQFSVYEFEAKEEMRKEIAKAETDKTKTIAKETIKKAEESIKADWGKKLKTQKAKHEEEIAAVREKCDDKIQELKNKHEKQVVFKDEEQKKKINEIKSKNQHLEKEMKELKADHQQIQKNLKSDHQEQIKQLKPEHSKIVKEKGSMLKEKQNQIASLERAGEKSKTDIEKLQNAVNQLHSQTKKLEASMKEKDDEVENLQNVLSTRYEELNKLTATNEKLIESYNAKLGCEGERWQLQNNRAEKYAQELTQQQRTNIVLRNGLNSSTNRVEDLEIQLLVAKERIEGLENGKTGAMNACTQTADGEATMGEDSTAKHSEDESVAVPMLNDKMIQPQEEAECSDDQS